MKAIRYALHFINYQLISISETATGESAASARKDGLRRFHAGFTLQA